MLLVTMNTLVGMFSHAYFFIRQGELSIFADVISILIFTIPGVVVGAQLGVLLSNRINRNFMGKFVGVLFLILAVLTFLTIVQ